MPIDIFNPTAPRRRRTAYTLTIKTNARTLTRTLDRAGNAAAEIETAYYTLTESPLSSRDESTLDHWDTRRPLRLRDADLTATIETVTR